MKQLRCWLRKWLGFSLMDAKLGILHGMIDDQAKRIHTLEGELYDFRSALRAKAAVRQTTVRYTDWETGQSAALKEFEEK